MWLWNKNLCSTKERADHRSMEKKWDFLDFPVGLPNLRGRKSGTSWFWKLMEALAVVFPFQCITLTLVEADNETLLPVRGYLAIANDCSCEVTDHGGVHVTGCLYHHHYAWWARCFARLHLRTILTISMVIGMGGHSTGGWSDRD